MKRLFDRQNNVSWTRLFSSEGKILQVGPRESWARLWLVPINDRVYRMIYQRANGDSP